MQIEVSFRARHFSIRRGKTRGILVMDGRSGLAPCIRPALDAT